MDSKQSKSLKIRMAVTVLLMAMMYSVFVGVLLMIQTTILVPIISIALLFGVMWKGPDITLRATGANMVEPRENPEIHNRVSRLSQQAGIKKPDVAISETSAPNAFVSGKSSSSAVLCITEGMLERLDGDELDAVIAHELSHIKNRDMTIMMIASTFAAIAHFIVRWGWMMDGGGQEFAAIYGAIFVSFFVWIGSFVLMRVLSTYREFTADRGSAEITGDPLALVSALEKIENISDDIPDDDLRKVSGTNAMNFYEVDSGYMTSLMSTHPDPEERVDKLESMSEEI